MEFEWDARNLWHVMVESPHGVNPVLLHLLASDQPKFFREARSGRTGDYQMIATDDAGRFWTIVLVRKGPDIWRPITGWPSTNSQVRRYQESK